MSSVFDGIIAPITTPFSDDGEVSIDGLHKNLERYQSTPLSGVLVTGTTGEGAHLSIEERVAVLSEASDVWPQDKRLLKGGSYQWNCKVARTFTRCETGERLRMVDYGLRLARDLEADVVSIQKRP